MSLEVSLCVLLIAVHKQPPEMGILCLNISSSAAEDLHLLSQLICGCKNSFCNHLQASGNAVSVLDESMLLPGQGTDMQYQEDMHAQDPALEAAPWPGQAAEKSVEDWYREMHFYYNDSLQQYSATKTEEWLRQHYGALMDGFLIWLKVIS